MTHKAETYIPKHWGDPDAEGYYLFMRISPISSVLDRSNYYSAISKLGPNNLYFGEKRSWATGKIQCAYIHKDSDPALLKKADDIIDDITEHVLLDDELYMEMLSEEVHHVWASISIADRIACIQEYNAGCPEYARVSIFSARSGTHPSSLFVHIAEKYVYH